MFLLSGIIGALFGTFITSLYFLSSCRGTLNVLESDEPGSAPYLYLELDPKGSTNLQKKKYVRFLVHKVDDSRE